jgi:hydrogenase large subunit
MDRLGRGCETFISGGGMELPDLTEVKGRGAGKTLWPSGVYADHQYRVLEPGLIAEDISCSFYHGETSHPQDARTRPDLDNADGRKYSWAKAPRYDGRPAETGPVADFVTAGEPLFVEWLKTRGNSVFLRELARFVRPAYLLPVAEQWLDEMAETNTAFYQDHLPKVNTKGFGLVPAPRGMLGHWVDIHDGKIANYQVVTPTAWNASPRDARDIPGPCEQALLGTVVADPEHPTELEQVVRSFDPCLVCTVHAVRNL